jgi:hypothetical protein
MLRGVFAAHSVINGLGAKGTVDHYRFAAQCGFYYFKKLR